MMADIRMLQEQNQRLQLALVALTETLKTVTTRLDEQAAATPQGVRRSEAARRQRRRRSARAAREARRDQRAAHVALAGRGWRCATRCRSSRGQPAAGARRDRSERRRPSPARRGRPRRPATAPAASAGRRRRHGDDAAAAVRDGVCRLHRRPVVAGRAGVRDVSEDVPEVRSRRRRAVLHRRVVQRGQQVPRGRRRLRARDQRLSAERHPAGGVLQGRDHATSGSGSPTRRARRTSTR